MIKEIKTDKLYTCENPLLSDFFKSCVYPWEILPKIKNHILEIIEKGAEGYSLFSKDILVGNDVTIHSSAVIEAPAIIGSNTHIRPGAYLRGNVIIGSGCVVGNSSELKNCILLDGVQVPHYNYVGDSVLGNKVHMGAGAICSNLKAGGGKVIIHGDDSYPTNLRKVGAFLADGADIGCGCVLNPGTVIGRGTSVYPLTSLRGVYPGNCIIKSQNNIAKRT